MPWHDIGVVIEGDTAMDIAHHYVQLWNNAKLDQLGTGNKTGETTLSTSGRFKGMISRVFSVKRPRRGSTIISKKNLPRAIENEREHRQETEDAKFDEGFDDIIMKS